MPFRKKDAANKITESTMISIVFMVFSLPPAWPVCSVCFLGSVWFVFLLLCVSYKKKTGNSYIAMPQFCHKNATATAFPVCCKNTQKNPDFALILWGFGQAVFLEKGLSAC